MKKFASHVTLDQLRARCAERKYLLCTHLYDTRGHDHVTVTMPGPDNRNVIVLYNVVNGRFFGVLPDRTHFSSDKAQFEGTPWFDAMLELFYVEAP